MICIIFGQLSADKDSASYCQPFADKKSLKWTLNLLFNTM